MKQKFVVEKLYKGCWQSVFPRKNAEYSQLHATRKDAIVYLIECKAKIAASEVEPAAES